MSDRNLSWIYSGSLLVVFLSWIYVFPHWSPTYLPAWSDEFFYWVNSYGFYISNNFQAILSFDGFGSKILGADAHGPAYPLLHGGFAKIIGWNNFNFQLLNGMYILLMIVLVISNHQLKGNQKLEYLALMLTYPLMILFSFSFLQEILQAFFALLIAILLNKLNANQDSKKYLAYLILTIIVAGTLRSLWFLWGFALIPFIWKRYSMGWSLINVVTWPILAGVFSVFFMETLPNKFGLMLDNLFVYKNYYEAFTILFENTKDNLRVFFFDYGSIRYSLMRPLFFILLVYFTVLQFKTPSKIFQSIIIVGWVNFALLIFLYDAYYWRDIRTMSPLFYFLGFFFVIHAPSYLKIAFQITTLISFIIMIPVSLEWIEIQANVDREKIEETQKELFEIFEKENFQKPIRVLVEKSFYMENSLLTLPIIYIQKEPIRYIIPYYPKSFTSPDYRLFMVNNEIKLEVYSSVIP